MSVGESTKAQAVAHADSTAPHFLFQQHEGEQGEHELEVGGESDRDQAAHSAHSALDRARGVAYSAVRRPNSEPGRVRRRVRDERQRGGARHDLNRPILTAERRRCPSLS